ncbi:hypothetical protein ABPG74_006608 [Tetrahymena malaccensis]
MNKYLSCNLHSNYPIFHINLLEGALQKLQCVKCISIKQGPMNNLLIPEIINFDDKSLTENWPPLSDEQLRKKILDLKIDNRDLNKSILQFYDQLTQEINQILSQKKKDQLIKAERIYELKAQIVEQYQKMASIDKIKSCIIQEDEQLQKIEQDLKDLIDSQISKKQEYTSILSCMMQQYELISQIDFIKPSLIKQNILEILKIVNLLPQHTFNFTNQNDIYSNDNINTYKQKVEEEQKIIKKDIQKVEQLVQQLHLCNESLIKNMYSKDWYLDDFLVKQQKLLITTQINQAQFLRDVNQTAFQLKSLITQNLQNLGQNSKYFNKFIYSLQLKNNNIIFSSLRNSSDYLSVTLNSLSKFQIERIQNGQENVSCYFNYILKPHKKYIFKINLFSTNKQSKFAVGLISKQNINKFDLNEKGLGFLLNNQNQKIFSGIDLLSINQNQNEIGQIKQLPSNAQNEMQDQFQLPIPKNEKQIIAPSLPQKGQQLISQISINQRLQPSIFNCNKDKSIFMPTQKLQKNGISLFQGLEQTKIQSSNLFANNKNYQSISPNQNKEKSLDIQPQQQQQESLIQLEKPIPQQEQLIIANLSPPLLQLKPKEKPPIKKKKAPTSQIKYSSLFNNVECFDSIQTLEFRVCLNDQLIQYCDNSNKSLFHQFENKNSINKYDQYHFGFEFYKDYIKDKLEILDFQELDEFPNK